MLKSINNALSLSKNSVEILCSWNGNEEDKANVINESGYDFFIAQNQKYHYATNINNLAYKASGEFLALINDDVELDPCSLDSGLRCIEGQTKATLVGALLRTPDQRLQHIGFTFDAQFNPHHIAQGIINAQDACEEPLNFEVPAVTAAVAIMRRELYLKILLNQSYQRCGEDVEFNLDLRQKHQGQVLLCPTLSGVHDESATRAETGEKGNTSEDLIRMRARIREFFEQASISQLRVSLDMANRERSLTLRASESIKEQLLNLANDAEQQQLLKDRDHWQRQAQILQLENLKLKDAINRREGT